MSRFASGVPSSTSRPGVDVLGVLPEDHHVDLLGVLHRRRHAGEPAHRAQAHVEVEDLAQRDVERLRMPPPIGVVSGPLIPMRCSRNAATVVLGQPVAGGVERLLPGQHLLPGDLLAVLRRGGVHHELRRGPDVDAGAVALDEGDDRLVGDGQHAVGAG